MNSKIKQTVQKLAKHKTTILLVLILSLGFFLRFWRLAQFMPFSGDEGRDYLIARDMLVLHQFPLSGPPTSLGWFQLGPIFYYFLAPVLLVGSFHPVSGAVLTVVFDLIAICLLFLLAKEIFNQKVAVLASFFYAVSPYTVVYARTPLHVSLSPFFAIYFYIFFWLFLRKRELKYFYLCCIVLGILFQLHLTAIILVFIFILFTARKVKMLQFVSGAMFFLLAQFIFLPIGVWQNRLTSLGKLMLWMPYRVLSGIGIVTRKNVLTVERMTKSVNVLFDVLKTVFFGASREISLLLFVISLLIFVKYSAIVKLKFIYKGNKSDHNVESFRFPTVIIALFTTALFVHGQPSPHYFILIVPLIILLLAYTASRFRFVFVLCLFVLVSNTIFLYKSNFFTGVPLSEQIEIVKYMIKKAEGEKFQIATPSDIVGLPGYYRNYHYLVWWLGGNLSEASLLQFTIYQRKTNIASFRNGQKLKEFPDAIIIQSKWKEIYRQ